ncbi:MAG: hypothetical protein IJY04_06520, partial [Clostridia bacterium]|nr:hypothetical protein [Clostridia bacterium]MBQ9116661.1 hypothetical protein [Clostridia bacterium]
GIAPAELLTAEDSLSELEKYIETDYYEELLRRVTLDSNHRACIIMLPTAEEDAVSAKITEREKKLSESIDSTELERIEGLVSALRERQNTPDSDEAIATVPTLELSDIKPYKSNSSAEISENHGAKVLRHSIETNGILYTELYFYAQNLSSEDLTKLSILSSLLTNLDTDNYTARELKTEIKSRLGGLSALALSYTRVSDGGAIPLFAVKLSSLVERAEDTLSLIKEVLLRTKYDDKDRIKQILTQIRSATEDTVFSSGDGIATERVEGALCDAGRVNEDILGLTAYRRIKEYENEFSERADKLVTDISALAAKIFTRDRLLLSIAGDAPCGFAEKIVEMFPAGGDDPMGAELSGYTPLREGVRLPVHPAHTALGVVSSDVSEKLGVFKVAQTILSYEYLWGRIRVLGGAYGAGMVSRRYGGVVFSSYRDPSPKNSIEVFRGAAEFLRELAKSDLPLDKYIIGAVGEYDILKSPRTEAAQASADYITGWTEDLERRLLEQMLACDSSELIEAADILDRLMDSASFTVVGDERILSEIEGISIITP